MAEIDPLIFEFHARTSKFRSDVKGTTTSVGSDLDRMEARFRASSERISSNMKGLAGSIAAYFTGRELVGLADSFTRLQNNLRVAGLEGEAFAQVQRNLLDISQRYGVGIETLSSVFLKASLAQKELGASTDQIIRLNEIVAASLKITGTSAEEARGALLQLGQALGSDVVRGEEFNSLLENALPVVQAAARGIDRFGGSVARLRKEVVDGKVSSQEFFQGILRGGTQTLQDAEKAVLTLSGGYEALSSALVVYFGEADKANGASAALGIALTSIAENLDTIIPLLATVGLALGVGYVSNAIAARVATVSLGVAAASTGQALLAAFGGPVGLAITAVIAGLGYVVSTSAQATAETERLAAAADRNAAEFLGLGSAAGTAADETSGLTAEQIAAKVSAAGLTLEVDKLADAHYRAAVMARTQRIEEQKLALGQSARKANQLAQKLKDSSRITAPGDRRGTVLASTSNRFGKFTPETGQQFLNSDEVADFRRDKAALEQMQREPITLEAAMPAKASVSSGKKDKANKGTSGPSATDIAARQASEIARLQQEEIRARIGLTEDVNERSNLERELLTAEYQDRARQIEEDKDLSRKQKDAQIAILQALYGVQKASADGEPIIVDANNSLYAQAIERERQLELLRREGQLASDASRAQEDVLQSQLALVTNREERARLEKQLLDIQIQAAKDELRNQIAIAELAGGREKEVALLKQRLANLDVIKANESTAIFRDNESPLQRYARGLRDSDLGDQAEQLVVDEIEHVRGGMRDAIAKAIGTDDPLIKGLLDMLLQEVIFRPLADALSKSGSGGGGLTGLFTTIGSAIGSLFGGGRASGGRVSAGTMYRVNEGASPGRVEGFMPDVAGTIVPLGRMNVAGAGSQQSGMATVRLELSGDLDARIQSVSGPVAVEVVRASAPRIIDASASETARRFNRPRL